MLVFWAEKLVFLAVPKTGTTAIEGALAPRASMVLRDPPQLKHSPVYRYKRFLQPLFAQGGGQDDMETFAMVPMTLTISQDVEARLRDRRAFEFEVWNAGQS